TVLRIKSLWCDVNGSTSFTGSVNSGDLVVAQNNFITAGSFNANNIGQVRSDVNLTKSVNSGDLTVIQSHFANQAVPNSACDSLEPQMSASFATFDNGTMQGPGEGPVGGGTIRLADSVGTANQVDIPASTSGSFTVNVEL